MRYVWCVTEHGYYVVEPDEIAALDAAEGGDATMRVLVRILHRRQAIERRLFG